MDKKGKTMRTKTRILDSYVIEKKDKHGRWRACQEIWAYIYAGTEADALTRFNQRLKSERLRKNQNADQELIIDTIISKQLSN